eukprot:4908592-Amphidinium_carterae.1
MFNEDHARETSKLAFGWQLGQCSHGRDGNTDGSTVSATGQSLLAFAPKNCLKLGKAYSTSVDHEVPC